MEREPGTRPEQAVPVEPANVSQEPVVQQPVVQQSSPTLVQPVVMPAYDPRAERIVWLITAVVDVLLAMRFIFKLLGASTQSPFVALLYGLTAPLAAPFQGMFGSPAQSGSVLESASLVGLIIYALIGWGIVSLIRIRHSRRRPPP